MTTARPKVIGGGAGGVKKLNEKVDEDAPLVDVVAARDDSLADTRKKHFDILDLGDRIPPTLSSNSDILKANGGGGAGLPPRHHHSNRNYLSNSTPYPPPYGKSGV